MAISKVNYNSLNVTPSASKFLAWDSDADALAASDIGGSLNLISTQTASSSASLSFTSGIDSTYKEYIFKIINVHPSASNQRLAVNFSVDTGSNYNVTKTTTSFRAAHTEADGTPDFGYVTSQDLAQGTGFQNLFIGAPSSAGNDSSGSGTLHLFDPSNTTFVKHFIFRGSSYQENDAACDSFIAGYGNTTSAIDAVQFKFVSGNIDSGVIKMYGVT
jgi:hypothetical protein|tara:strand:+ start:2544 stop:3194 length:651 start_codon:yes stop_codon:yes gene_type:complete